MSKDDEDVESVVGDLLSQLKGSTKVNKQIQEGELNLSNENLEEFLSRFEKENGDVVFFAISVPHYENLSLNMADLRRYIGQ